MAAECTETSLLNPNPNPNNSSSTTQSWWQEIMHANSLSCSNFPWQQYFRTNNPSSEMSAGEDGVSISNRSVLAAESTRLQLVDEAAGALPCEFIRENLSDHQSHLWDHLLLSGESTRGGLDHKSQPREIGESSMLINLSSSPSSSNTTTAAATTAVPTTAATTANFIFDIMSSSDDGDYLNRMGTTTTTLDHHHQDYYNTFINNNNNLHDYGGGGGGQKEIFDHHRLPPLSFTDEQLQGVSYNSNDFMAASGCFQGGNGMNEYDNGSRATDLIKASPDFPAGCIGNNKKRGAAGLHTSPTRASTCSTIARSNSGRCQGSLATNKDSKKKKKLEEDMEKMILKRPKDDKSSSKEEKLVQQVPKVKLADKITALQQIVSPFGKTDTASVLWEALGHIRFLQEQIQLLTNAHAKSNAIRKDVPWGGLIVAGGRKDAGSGGGGGGGEDEDVDLRSRGLCLVPTSFTPLVFREKNSNASDYLIPTYRGCLYG